MSSKKLMNKMKFDLISETMLWFIGCKITSISKLILALEIQVKKKIIYGQSIAIRICQTLTNKKHQEFVLNCNGVDLFIKWISWNFLILNSKLILNCIKYQIQYKFSIRCIFNGTCIIIILRANPCFFYFFSYGFRFQKN